MKVNRTFLMVFCSIWAFICIGLSGCTQNDRAPVIALQKYLAAQVAEPKLCPTGTSSDIQLLVKSPATDGIVHLPAGCYQITSTVALPACTRLVGAGVEDTILYRNPDKTYSQPMLSASGNQKGGCVTQISGLSLLGVRNTHDTGQDYGILITNIKDFRLDHSYFEGFGFAAVRVQGDSRGLIDHAIFVDNYKQGIDNLGYGVVVYGKGYWEDDFQPGSDRAIFVEDSLFSGNRHAIAASAGAYYVFRNNTVQHNVQACSVDAHGMGYGSAHGTQFVEIYRNDVRDPVYAECGIGIRGGGGVIFENSLAGYKNPILLILEWGTPDRLKAEYPALDQIQGLYIWDNTIRGGHGEPQVDISGLGFIELDRDYFTSPLANYVPYPYPHALAGAGPLDGTPWPPLP